MQICQSNCGQQSIKIYFTQVTEMGLATERTHLESGDIYANEDGYLDLTKEVRMFVSILENPEIKFILRVLPTSAKLCDVCFKEQLDAKNDRSKN